MFCKHLRRFFIGQFGLSINITKVLNIPSALIKSLSTNAR